jgi:dTDP-4-amino-4,6-dideoxygalactose transaminase
MIPILELSTQYAQIKTEVEEAALRALRSTHYILGPEVEAFEAEFAAWNGAQFGIGVGNGTDALHLALRALGVGAGDEVICPSFTFVATAGAAALTGATPVFADIDPQTYTLDPASVEAAITPRTRAIVAVHLYGHPAPMEELQAIARRHGLGLVEDCAQSTGATLHGRRAGSLGDLGCFSFFPSKNLGGIGDGGMVLTSNPELAEKVRMLRGHGSKVRYYHDMVGTNSRLDEIQAAVLRVKLRHLEAWNLRRREIAAAYTAGLEATFATPPVEKPGCEHVYHQYTLRAPDRDALQKHMQASGVGAVIYYPVCLHMQKAFSHHGLSTGSLPVSEKAQAEVLSLPMFPELTGPQIETVLGAIKSFSPAPAPVG